MQALEYRRSGKLPDSFTVSTEQEEPKTPKKPHSNGAHAQDLNCFEPFFFLCLNVLGFVYFNDKKIVMT